MVEVIITFILGCFTFVVFSVKCMTILQQCGYKIGEFFTCVFISKKKEILLLSTYSLVFVVLFVITSLVFSNFEQFLYPVYFSVVIGLSSLFLLNSKIIKQPILTGRFLRVFILSGILSGCFSLLIGVWLKNIGCFSVLGVGLIPILCPTLVTVGWGLEFPYSKLLYWIGVKRCKKRIKNAKSLIKIGITGSFGKTTTKLFLEKMLSTKYRVLATPKSFNTPLGICKTVDENIENYDIFIAEMGARYKNDIKTLCKIVKPNIGIVSGISAQHTETLGGIEGVKNAKYQLIEGLIGKKYAVFSSDSEGSVELFERATVEKNLSGINSGVVSAKNAKQTESGIEFDLVVGDKIYPTFAPVLGVHNLTDICLAVAVSLKLGVEIDKILTVIPTLKGPPHRAEIIKTRDGVTIIDDGYNGNLVGIMSTSQAVKVFKGNKIAVTAGIVELGELTKEINREVGEILSANFDVLIAVGGNARFIKMGAINKPFYEVKSLDEAKEILSSIVKMGDVVAFFNDVPDRY